MILSIQQMFVYAASDGAGCAYGVPAVLPRAWG